MANWFVGLPVPAGGWFDALRADIPRGLRIFGPGDLHITLAFLGACGEAAAMRGWAALPALGARPFEVRLGDVRGFGRPSRPSAFSVVLAAGADDVAGYIGATRDPVLAAAGARPDRRTPRPHLTIARPPRRAKATEIRAAQAWARSVPPLGAALELDRVALYTWRADRARGLFCVVEARSIT